MNKQKQLWEKLAKENSKYYIYTDKGRDITNYEFGDSGSEDYVKYILEDDLIKKDPQEACMLDLGCGIGRMTRFMALDFKKVIGIDISGEMIRQGKEALQKKRYSNVEFIETDGESIPLKDSSVDVVFSYIVFHHMKTKEIVEKNFKEVYRVLKPGGLFKVLLRSDKQKNLNSWWAGVHHDKESVDKLCADFKILKREKYDKFGFWLWLEK